MAFIYGFLAAILALFLQMVVWIFFPNIFSLPEALTFTTLGIILLLALTEEVARFLFIYQYLKKVSVPSIFLPALFFGLGFAILEVLFTFWTGFSAKVFFSSALHLILTLFVFWFLQGPFTRRSVGFILIGTLLIHTLFNLIVVQFSA